MLCAYSEHVSNPQHRRVGAYAVCINDEKVLLARWVSRTGERHWTLPGGGVEHGEDPYDATIREVEEETGYQVAIDRLLGVDSANRQFAGQDGATVDFHHLRIVYAAHVVGGQLRHEVDGSTDLAAWVPLAEVAALDKVSAIDIGLELYRTHPPTGRIRHATVS